MDIYTVRLFDKCNVTLLEDSEMRIGWFKARVPNLTVCRTVDEFKAYFSGNPPCDFVFWDHDLGTKETGADAAKWFMDRFGASNRYHMVHSFNRAGAQRILGLLPAAVHIPFGEFDIEFV